MDDSYNDQTHISSITGLLVPASLYSETRSRFYKIVPRAEKILADGTRFIDIRPPELRGSKYLKNLPNADENLIFQTLEGVVELVVTQNLEVYRSGCYITQETSKLSKDFNIDWRLHDICWLNMVSMLEAKMTQEMIVPVMDGFSATTVKTFSQFVKNMDLMRSAGWGPIMNIKNTENILGEVFYCDSRYSIFTQIADNIEYLREVADLAREGKALTSFKRRLLPISERLSPSIIREEITLLKIAEATHE